MIKCEAPHQTKLSSNPSTDTFLHDANENAKRISVSLSMRSLRRVSRDGV